MKTIHALIIGCAIILGFGLHAFMNRYEHSTKGGEGYPIVTSRINKLTGTLKYFGLMPLKGVGSLDEVQSVIFPMDIHEVTKDTTSLKINGYEKEYSKTPDIESHED